MMFWNKAKLMEELVPDVKHIKCLSGLNWKEKQMPGQRVNTNKLRSCQTIDHIYEVMK